ncbi:hypothetical protein PMIN03_012743 [Paraphaeosphaeria minitans]
MPSSAKDPIVSQRPRRQPQTPSSATDPVGRTWLLHQEATSGLHAVAQNQNTSPATMPAARVAHISSPGQ